MIRRKKVGNTTITIDTRTGRQTTSRRNGNITHSQSNQGHNRTTVTTNYGNGWFDRKTTNHNKKSRKKKSIWPWLFGSSKSSSRAVATTSQQSIEQIKIVEVKPEFIGPPYPIFYKRKSFKQFDGWEWVLWIILAPFRATWFIIKWYIIFYVLMRFSMYIFSLF